MGRRRRSRGKCFSNGNVKIDNFIKRKSKLRQNGKYTGNEMLDCCFADKT
jgi:hypothetical protein